MDESALVLTGIFVRAPLHYVPAAKIGLPGAAAREPAAQGRKIKIPTPNPHRLCDYRIVKDLLLTGISQQLPPRKHQIRPDFTHAAFHSGGSWARH